MYKHLILAVAILATGSAAASATTIDKSVTVKVPAEQVWKMIGPFCSIQDWHPAIGSCTETGDRLRTSSTEMMSCRPVQRRRWYGDLPRRACAANPLHRRRQNQPTGTE